MEELLALVQMVLSHRVHWSFEKLRTKVGKLSSIEERDHREIKFRIRSMLGFKNFESASNTIAGVELLRRIYKCQFALGRLGLKGQAVPAIWNTALAA